MTLTVLNQGFDGNLDFALRGLGFACIFELEGLAAFGRLDMNGQGEPCPQGIWLPGGVQAIGFRRRPKLDARTIFMRTEVAERRSSRLEVPWFMPVIDTGDTERIWNTFLAKMEPNIADHLRKPTDGNPTLGQPFGGLGAKLKVTVSGQSDPTVVTVVGMCFNHSSMAYQVRSSTQINGTANPIALVRGWTEPLDRCRVVFRDRSIESIDAVYATFSHL